MLDGMDVNYLKEKKCGRFLAVFCDIGRLIEVGRESGRIVHTYPSFGEMPVCEKYILT